jgi:hypothetical protein
VRVEVGLATGRWEGEGGEDGENEGELGAIMRRSGRDSSASRTRLDLQIAAHRELFGMREACALVQWWWWMHYALQFYRLDFR